MKKTHGYVGLRSITSILAIPVLAYAPLGLSQSRSSSPAVVVNAQSKTPPSELNPPFTSPKFGGAPNATPAQAAVFAWQEFIALNWPARPQSGKLGQRDTP